jgi:hypothetical protein
MSVKYLVIAATLAFAPAALAQATGNAEPQIKPTGAGPGTAQETSDRTPAKTTQTPQNQTDTYENKTSDRSGNSDVKVDHQPAAAGTAGTERSGSSSGDAGSATR